MALLQKFEISVFDLFDSVAEWRWWLPYILNIYYMVNNFFMLAFFVIHDLLYK